MPVTVNLSAAVGYRGSLMMLSPPRDALMAAMAVAVAAVISAAGSVEGTVATKVSHGPYSRLYPSGRE